MFPAGQNNASVAGMSFSRVIEVKPHLNLEMAANITKDNGYDEVYLRTASGKLFAAVGLGGKLDVRPGYTGTVNGEWAQVVHVDDEMNSAAEGAKSPFTTLGNLLKTSGSTAVTAAVTTTVAGAMTASAMTVSKATVGAIAKSAGGAFVGALQRLAVSGLVGLGIAGVAIGIWSGIGAIRGATRQGDEMTLQQLSI